ncbi:IgGFc-binding protein-like [Anarrhichthys ocellatus]|uniref:IgGFc-binding protein-like n=1 Tax=Anarrhichthys ocellatus TaxID=433405 RepID=UPI0012EE3D5C|nr:IgGFc-binding protein-like [Anarrhichthys ocellatus]
MEIKPLSVCLAVCAALLAVCHGVSTGKEFITTFLPNSMGSNLKGQTLQLVLTAKCTEANIGIQVASVNFNKQLKLAAGESRWVSLPRGAELQKQFDTAKSAVRISSSAAISVVSFNRRFSTGDGAVVSPLEELGTDYFVYTPKPYRGMDSLFAIVNGNSENRISILPKNNVKLKGGKSWQCGRRENIILAPYASYLVRGQSTLTGTRIQSQQPVAVLAGHQCLSMGYTCEHVYEQLPAVAKLGKEYLVPTTSSSKAINTAVIVAVEDNTELTLHTQKQLSSILIIVIYC